MKIRNPTGTDGFDFLEFTTNDPKALCSQFEAMGFLPVATHNSCPVTIYQQNGLRFFINLTPNSQASHYARHHGTAISAMGFKLRDAKVAMQYVNLKGATTYQPLDETQVYEIPAIYGVGNSLIYFVDYKNGMPNYAQHFSNLPQTPTPADNDLKHLSQYLYHGNIVKWADFYARLFNFYELVPDLNHVTIASPCNKIRIALNESSSQNKPEVEDFLNYFNGEGIQQISFGSQSFEIMPHQPNQNTAIKTILTDFVPEAVT